MYKDSRILALIPARAGSKGIKKKNIIDLNNKPLIAYSIQEALNSRYVDSVIVSTDGEDIAIVSKKYGADVPFIRPKELAEDSSKTIDAVIHALQWLQTNGKNYDVLVLLQPTQPLRTMEDIDGAIEVFFEKGMEDLASVCEVEDHPLLVRSIDEEGNLKNLLEGSSTKRRQDFQKYYKVNGCIYINKVSKIDDNTSFNDNRIPYFMSREKSVDIDTVEDLWLASKYLEEKGNEILY